MKQQITQQIQEILKDLGHKDVDLQVDYPADARHGDYTTNVAMVAAKKLGKNPRELASELQERLKDSAIFEKVEVAGPGFINFWVKDEVLVVNVIARSEVTKQSQPGSEPNGGLPHSSVARNDGIFKGKKIVVEYTDPNPFKELHIGHLYSNIIGESLCRLFEATGATVRRVDYYGDVGMHVAKSLWGLMKKMKDEKVTLSDLEKTSLTQRIAYLGEGYALGSNAFAEDPQIADEIKDINYLVYMSGQEYQEKKLNWKPQINYKKYLRPENEALYAQIKELYEKGKDWSLENFERAYARLGTTFDGYYPESIAGERGYTLVKDNIENGIFVESEGAVIFPGEKYGLHNRVFINKLGLPTYEAKEIGLPPWKYEEFPYDLSFIVTATEIAGYFSVLIEALKKVNPELGEKTKPLLHGMVKLPEGKMSSRSGNVIAVNKLLDEAREQVLPRVSEEIENREEVAEMVGVGAVKYAFLKSSIGKDIIFDFDESVSFEGNSGPYIQYTYARTQSVLRKAGDVIGSESSRRLPRSPQATSIMTGSLDIAERDLLRLIVRFDEIVEEAAVRYSPSTVATYLFELAQAFNLFYQKHHILKGEADKLQLRLGITSAIGETLKKGLTLLGIKAPDRM